MHRTQFAHRYTGARVVPFAPPMGHFAPGHCRSCGQPSGQCCCGCRECRKEAKELVVDSRDAGGKAGGIQTNVSADELKVMTTHFDIGAVAGHAAAERGVAPAAAKAFIGGGCCVHLAIEYAPVTPTAISAVAVLVTDSEGTIMLWMKRNPAGTTYQVKECIVTTKPGATVILAAVNATARLRWCEVFSC